MNNLAQLSLAADASAIGRASSVYRAVNHSLRLKIIEIIHKEGILNVTPIIQQLKLEQSVISAHLKILRDAKIVKTEKKGISVFYSINYIHLNRILMCAERLIPYRTHPSGFLQNADRDLILRSKDETIRLTPIEQRIINLVCKENSDEEIAFELGLSQKEIENHLGDITRKMRVKGSVGILLFAVKQGLFKP